MTRQQDYGPAYAASLVESAQKLAELMERVHDMFAACEHFYGPKRRPTYVFEARGMWGPDSKRRWTDRPCRACVLARQGHDPGDEDPVR